MWISCTIIVVGGLLDLHSTSKFSPDEETNEIFAPLWAKHGFKALIAAKLLGVIVIILGCVLIHRSLLKEFQKNIKRSHVTTMMIAIYLVPLIGTFWIFAALNNYFEWNILIPLPWLS